jgi:tight adherence protein B
MTLRRPTRVVAAALAAAAATLLCAAPAYAAEGRIVTVGSDGGTIDVVFTATGLAGGQTIDQQSVVLQLQGRTIPADVKAATTEAVRSTSVLVMDTSGSMAGDRIATAKSAAKSYLAAVPSSTVVGLVTFADAAQERIPPTTNRSALIAAIDSLQADGDTALYDGVTLGVKAAGATGARSVLVLSDGADTSSKTSPTPTVNAIKKSGVVLDVVSIGTDSKQVAGLQRLADAGRGQVIASNNLDVVTAAFDSAAQSVSSQVAITAQLPTDLAGTSGNVTVNASASGDPISATAFVSIPEDAGESTTVTDFGPAAVPPPSDLISRLTQPWVLAVAALLLFIGLAMLLAIALRTSDERRDPQRKVSRRLSIYTLSGRQAVKESETSNALGTSGIARTAVDLANRVVSKRDFESVLGERLERAAVPLKPAEWMLLHVGATIGGGLLVLLLSGGSFIGALIGIIIGAVLPFGYLVVKESRRTSAFMEQIPDTLQLIAGSLSTGYSLPQAIDAAARDAAPPVSTEFDRALVEARLGVPIEDALEGVAHRMRSVDFAWVVMAIRIQREVGGNLSEVLNTTAATLRDRERLRRQVQVLSAEGRLSAWILGGLPIVFALYLALARPDYLRPLYTTLLGWAMVALAAILMVVGILWLRKAVKVEV